MRCNFTSVVLAAAVALLCGCQEEPPIDMLATGQLKAVTDSGKVVEFSPPTVLKDHGVLIIKGAVKRQAGFDAPIPGHLDLMFLNDAGQAINMVRTSWEPRDIPVTGARQAEYTLRYAWNPPAGTTLLIIYHEGSDFAPSTGGAAGASLPPVGGSATYNQVGGLVYPAISPIQPSAIPRSPQMRQGENPFGYGASGRRK